jgi:hypothetical protein
MCSSKARRTGAIEGGLRELNLTDGGWRKEEMVKLKGVRPELPDELLERVLRAALEGGGKDAATFRLVCAAWKAEVDALVTRLVLSRQITDEATGMLVKRFPAVVTIDLKDVYAGESAALTDEGLRAVSSCSALTSLDLTGCFKMTHKGMRAVGNLPALTSLNLSWCNNKTADAGLGAVSKLPALTSLNLTGCVMFTDVGLEAVSKLPALKALNLTDCITVTNNGVGEVSKLTALTSLDLFRCGNVTDEGVRALSILPALTSLDLRGCSVTAAGVQELRNTTAAPSLHIIGWE